MLDVLRRRKVDGDRGVVENVLLPPAAAAAAAAAAVHHARLREGQVSLSFLGPMAILRVLQSSLLTGPSFLGCENVAGVVRNSTHKILETWER